MTKNGTKQAVAGLSLGLALAFILFNWSAARTRASDGSHETTPVPVATATAPERAATATEKGLPSAASPAHQLDLVALMRLAAHQAGGGSAPGAQGDKPVEQTAKNIKVLNGLPSSKLFPVMNFFSDSLGVRCTYCHVQGEGRLDFVSDAKPEKETAREMVKMVLAVNKESFGGNNAITCYTCHRGQARVIGLPPFPLPSRESMAAEAPRQDEAQAGLPTAEQLFDKYAQAIGGKAAFDKLRTRVWKGTITGQGDTATYEIQQAAPNKFLTTLTDPKRGSFITGFNGTVGWSQNARGTRAFSDAEVAQLKRLATFFGGGVTLKEQYTKMRVVGRDKVGEREAYVVRATNLQGNNERLYFDTQTGLLLRDVLVERTAIVPIPEQIDFDDYREVDGVKLPFTVQVYTLDPSGTATRKFTEVKHNVSVDESRFNMPPASAPKANVAKP